MDCYIVRIYRRDGKSSRLVVGTVEEIGVKGKKGFACFDELTEILAFPARRATRKGKGDHPDSQHT